MSSSLDVKNTFLHGHLSDTVYMHQPPGFRDSQHPDYVCLLNKFHYGLKQAPRAWYQRFADYVRTTGCHHSLSDTSLFIYLRGNDMTYLLLYVDDIILTASSEHLRSSIMAMLSSQFAMNDLGPHYYFWVFLSLAPHLVFFFPKRNMPKKLSIVPTLLLVSCLLHLLILKQNLVPLLVILIMIPLNIDFFLVLSNI